MADMIYNNFFADMGNGAIDLDTHTLKMALLTDSYTPLATHANFAAISGEVTPGGGYTAGGKALTGVTFNQTSGIAELQCDDIVWSAASITARYGYLYDTQAVGVTNPSILLLDFGQNIISSSNDFTITIDVNGLFRFATKGVI